MSFLDAPLFSISELLGLPIIGPIGLLLVISSVMFTSCFLCRKVASYQAHRFSVMDPMNHPMNHSMDHMGPRMDLGTSEMDEVEDNRERTGSVEAMDSFWTTGMGVEKDSAGTKIPTRLLQLAATKFVHRLEPEALEKMYAKMEWLHLKEHEVLFGIEEDTVGMFVVISGELGMYSRKSESNLEDELVFTVPKGESFGEFSLLLNENFCSGYECRALIGTDLIKVSKEIYEEFVLERPDVFLSFVKTTIASKWRIAHYALNTFFELPVDFRNDILTAFPSTGSMQRAALTLNTSESVVIGKSSPIHRRFRGSPTLNLFDEINKEEVHRLQLVFTDLLCESLARDADVLHLFPGEVLFKCGAQSLGRFYIFQQGKMVAYNEDNSKSWFIHEGEVLGAECLLTNGVYKKTLRILAPSKVFAISEAQLEQKIPYLQEIIVGILRRLYPVVKTFLRCGLQADSKHGGKFLFRKGQAANEMFIVCSGRLRIHPHSFGADSQKNSAVLMEVGRGQCVGETALLANDQYHSYSIVCIRDSELVKISRVALNRLCRDYPSVLKKLSSIMAHRLKSYDNRTNLNSRFSDIATIAILPTSNMVTQTHDFALSLLGSLSVHGKCKLIDESLTRAIVSNAKIYDPKFEQFVNQSLRSAAENTKNPSDWNDNYLDKVKMQTWLCEQEELHRYLIYEANFDVSCWTRLCTKQADLILLLACSADDLGQVNMIEHTLLEACPLSRVELAIIHDPSEAAPSGTARFLDPRPFIKTFHHLRSNNTLDFDRLARHFASKTVGVVLSGGGARGLAHLGVLKALEDSSIPIDAIAGTSQGILCVCLIFCIHRKFDGCILCKTPFYKNDGIFSAFICCENVKYCANVNGFDFAYHVAVFWQGP